MYMEHKYLVSYSYNYHKPCGSGKQEKQNRKENMTDITTQNLAKKMKSEYQKNWRIKNKAKVKEHNAKYWLKKAKEELSRKKA